MFRMTEITQIRSCLACRLDGKTARILFLLTTWYVTSSVAIVLTKILFSGSGALRSFPFALTVTATNNVVASAMAKLYLSPAQNIDRDSNVNRIALIIGATTAAEIGLSNFALNILSVSYATVLKGMAPLFVMSWGIILGLQRLRLEILIAFICIAFGLSLAVAGEAGTHPSLSNFVTAGFCAQFCSALLSGFRWMLTQIFVHGGSVPNERISSCFGIKPLRLGLSAVQTIRLTAPYTLFCVLPFLVLIEGLGIARWLTDADWKESLTLLLGLTIIGMSVYLLLWSEYELVKATSSLTVSVGFVMKEILLLFAGVVIFNDRLSHVTLTGFVIAQCGILGYATQRKSRAMQDQNGDMVV